MSWIQRLDLKKKLILLAAASGMMALSLACFVFVWHDMRLLTSVQIDEMKSKAEILGFKCASVVASDQTNAAEYLLTKLKPPASVESVCLFGRDGHVIATYPVRAVTSFEPELPANHYLHRYAKTGELEVFHPIVEQGQEIGVVYLKANMKDFYEQLYRHVATIIAVTVFSFAVTLALSSVMQSFVTRPILRLAHIARNIAMNEDYTTRVTTDSHDELGVLYSSFNRMVEKIQSSQAELKQARAELEQRVEERTQQLQDEIAQRELIQQELVRAKESAEAANVAKSRFLANVSHEVRTPLNGILGFADYLVIHDRNLSEKDRCDYLQTIKKSSEDLLALINGILDLSRIESGQMEFERVSFSPHRLIAEVISMMRPSANDKMLSLDYRWEGGVPDLIESDPARFRQLLINIVGNSIKFSESGKIDVVARFESSTRKLAIKVVDQGIGIAPETQQSIFRPFTQGDSSVTRRFSGTGLGLSICKSIVNGLGGEIGLISEVDQGSTFFFTIDAGPMENASFSSQSDGDLISDNRMAVSAGTLCGKHILVAEDGETNRKLIELLLQTTGAQLTIVENGLEAVNAARGFVIDLILMDMQMPVMDGYTATRQLRAEGFSMPIVALTANAMHGDENLCREAGCTGYLTKPIQQQPLILRISELLNHTLPEDCGAIASGDAARPNIVDHSNHLISELPTEDPAFAELVCEFIEHAREKMAEMHEAHHSKDDIRLAKLAHWMKGSGGMAGFPILTDTARELEGAINNQGSRTIDDSLLELESLIGQLQSPVIGSV